MKTKRIFYLSTLIISVIITSYLVMTPKCQRFDFLGIFKNYEDPNKEWFELMDRNDGVQYFWFKDKYYNETQLDSIGEVIHKKITEEMIRELDSTHLKN